MISSQMMYHSMTNIMQSTTSLTEFSFGEVVGDSFIVVGVEFETISKFHIPYKRFNRQNDVLKFIVATPTERHSVPIVTIAPKTTRVDMMVFQFLSSTTMATSLWSIHLFGLVLGSR